MKIKTLAFLTILLWPFMILGQTANTNYYFFPQYSIGSGDIPILMLESAPAAYQADIWSGKKYKRVRGEACSWSLRIPMLQKKQKSAGFYGQSQYNLFFSYGDHDFAKMSEQIKQRFGTSRLFDVRMDMQTTMYLILLREQCLVVHAKGY